MAVSYCPIDIFHGSPEPSAHSEAYLSRAGERCEPSAVPSEFPRAAEPTQRCWTGAPAGRSEACCEAGAAAAACGPQCLLPVGRCSRRAAALSAAAAAGAAAEGLQGLQHLASQLYSLALCMHTSSCRVGLQQVADIPNSLCRGISSCQNDLQQVIHFLCSLLKVHKQRTICGWRMH